MFAGLAFAAAVSAEAQEPREDEWSSLRQRMVQEQIVARGIQDSATLAAMRQVPRHLFVPSQYRRLAYEDTPLPIGREQTISQPYMVALMTELVHPVRGTRVLEVGTGSGYQAAVLAAAGCRVWTIEIFATGTDTRDGPTSRHSMPLSSPQVAIRCHPRSSSSSPRADAWSCRSATLTPINASPCSKRMLPAGCPPAIWSP
jgi:hypothetical protein